MVAKISVGNSLRATILYNARKVEDGEARVLYANRLFDSADGRHNPLQTIRELEDHLPSHFRTEKPTIHISLNPHPDDRLTDEQFAAIAEEYMERMGYGEQPYIVYKHEDISAQATKSVDAPLTQPINLKSVHYDRDKMADPSLL
ncbi:MAG: relaxase/mobilization nuclease domain-containing protein, partial [Rikenellaceae bacterium]